MSAEESKDVEAVKEFCERLELSEPYRACGHHETPHTCRGRGVPSDRWSWIDYRLVSGSLFSKGLVTACAVVVDED